MSSTGAYIENNYNEVWTSTLTIFVILFFLYLSYIGCKLYCNKKEKLKKEREYSKWLNKKRINITFPITPTFKFNIVRVQPLN